MGHLQNGIQKVPCRKLILLLAVLLISPVNAQTCIPAPTGLADWWPGDGNANDIAGAQNGSPQGGASFVPGKVGQAFNFDGVAALVNFGSTPGNFGTSDFTVDFWMKTNSTRVESVVGRRSICRHSSFWEIRMFNGPLAIELDQDSAGTNYNLIFTHGLVNDGNFHHVAVTRQGIMMSAYIDGVLDSTATTSGVTDIVNTAELMAGRSACQFVDGTQYFTGQLDELEIFNRALASSEIQAIFSAGSAGKCKAAANQSPVALCRSVTVAAGPACMANASIDNGSFDPDGDPIALSQSPAGPYPFGLSYVTLSATDDKGASSQCQASVQVIDDQPPVIGGATVDKPVLWPVSHKMVDVTVNYSAQNQCDLSSPVTCTLSVTANEPTNGNDWVILDAHHVLLRAERAGNTQGRVYTITITCQGRNGKRSATSVTVTVPHDQGQ
jgi:hypothetical protein